MSHRAKSVVLTLLLALAHALPLAAQNDKANTTQQVVNVNMKFNGGTSLAGRVLQEGTYTVFADGSKVTLSLHGKTVAEAPIQWKDETGKSPYSAIVTANGRITAFHFRGKTQYIVIER